MTRFFDPSIRLMNRLRYPYKMALLSAVFAVPLLVSMILLLVAINADISITEQEMIGLHYNRQLADFNRDLLAFRSMQYVYLKGGGDFSTELGRLRSRILDELKALDKEAATSGKALGATADWQALRAEWNGMTSFLEPTDADEGCKFFSNQISQTDRFIHHISDLSGLTLDTEMESYYLADILFTTLPALEEHIDLIRGRGAGMLTTTPPLPTEELRLQTIAHLMDEEEKKLTGDIKKIFTDSPQVRQGFIPQLTRTVTAVQDVRDLVATATSEPRDKPLLPADFFRNTTVSLQACRDLAAVLTPLLQSVLNERAERFQRKRSLILLFTLTAFSILLYLFAGNYVSVVAAIKELVRASDAMAGGDLTARANLLSQDEIATVATSFNGMAQELERSLQERQKAEDALRKSEGWLRAVLTTAAEAVITLDAQGSILSFNPAAEKIFGYTAAEIMGRNGTILVAPGDRKSTANPFPQQIIGESGWREGASGIHREANGFRKDGSLFPMDLSMSQVRFNQHHFFTCIIRDITERKEAEEQIRVLAKFPEENLSPVLRVSANGTILYANKASELLLRHWRCAPGDSPCQPIMDLVQTVLATGRNHYLEVSTSEETFLFNAVPIPELAYVNLYGQNITDRKRDEELLRKRQQMIEELNANLGQRVREEVAKSREKDMIMAHQARLAAMGEMIGNIAHQWRQPLSSLNLLLVNLRESIAFGDVSEETVNALIDRGKTIIDRMSSTIDDFRNFFRPDKNAEQFRLADAAQHAIQLIGASLQHHDITVEITEVEPVTATGFPNEFAQVVLNLLSNGRDAILSQGTTKGKMVISVRRDGDDGVMVVEDNGGGIPDGLIDRIFDPYFSTKDQGKGTGIGLYMSKTIIEELMHGRIVASNGPIGAVFEIRVPGAASAGNAGTASPQTPPDHNR